MLGATRTPGRLLGVALSLALGAAMGCVRHPAVPRLTSSLGLEQPGHPGILLPAGSELPIAATEVLTTTLDDQSSLEVHLLESLDAPTPRSRGWYRIEGIAPAPRRQGRAVMTVAIDAQGNLRVEAHDGPRALRVRALPGPPPAPHLGALAQPIEDDGADQDPSAE